MLCVCVCVCVFGWGGRGKLDAIHPNLLDTDHVLQPDSKNIIKRSICWDLESWSGDRRHFEIKSYREPKHRWQKSICLFSAAVTVPLFLFSQTRREFGLSAHTCYNCRTRRCGLTSMQQRCVLCCALLCCHSVLVLCCAVLWHLQSRRDCAACPPPPPSPPSPHRFSAHTQSGHIDDACC